MFQEKCNFILALRFCSEETKHRRLLQPDLLVRGLAVQSQMKLPAMASHSLLCKGTAALAAVSDCMSKEQNHSLE